MLTHKIEFRYREHDLVATFDIGPEEVSVSIQVIDPTQSGLRKYKLIAEDVVLPCPQIADIRPGSGCGRLTLESVAVAVAGNTPWARGDE